MYKYPKKFLSISQLIQKLTDAGMIINSKDEAELALTTIGYYRLRGYSYPYIDANTKTYISGTNFSNVLQLYYFDTELSHLIFNYLSQIEVALKVRLVNSFQSTQDALILNDPSAFGDKGNYWRNQGTIASEISRSQDLFIKHNFRYHDGAIPIWASVEVMSFGTISKIIKNMKNESSSAIHVLLQNYEFKNEKGLLVNPTIDMFTSWVHSVSVMRNICAHNSRIYNRSYTVTPVLIHCDKIVPMPEYSGLYQIMLSMKYLSPTQNSWTNFVSDFKRLLNKYEGVYYLEKMNFPSDWENHFE